MAAKERYDALASNRQQYLHVALDAARLTLPYLIRDAEESTKHMKPLPTPWQSCGAKAVVTLSSKLMLALLPPQTSFFKLQLDESKLGPDLPPQVRSELDLAMSKVERTMMEAIAASDDRVVVHQALKHLVVSGNALIFMGKESLKMYPLNRYVVERDGNGNVIEIITRERINKNLIADQIPKELLKPDKIDNRDEEVDIYTHVTRDNNRFVWHQECMGYLLPKSRGKAPVESNPWLVLRFNTVDGEVFGRGRVEEFMGDLRSLEGLTQALVEGSAAAAKVVFVVSPSSTTKPSTLAAAGNGAIVQGRPEDIGVIQTNKTGDFRTAYEMMGQLERRISEAFLILNVRQSERTTAEEVRMSQMELESQLGGLFSLLTVEFLVPYLNRKLSTFQKEGVIPRLPEKMIKPTIVAGINALGRGQDRESLGQFLTVIAQTMGPEAIIKYINPEEVVKRLAAAQGIDVLNLVKSQQELQQEQQQQMQQAAQMEQVKQVPQMAAVDVQQQKLQNEQRQSQQTPESQVGPTAPQQGGPRILR